MRVSVVWHGKGDSEGEANRRVWVALSKDEGKTFSREVPAYRLPTGACGCCGMRALADHQGNVYVLYRAATESVNRDMVLLISENTGRSFYGALVHKWKINACPMSTAFITEGNRAVLLAWETEGQVYYAEVGWSQFATTLGSATHTQGFPAESLLQLPGFSNCSSSLGITRK